MRIYLMNIFQINVKKIEITNNLLKMNSATDHEYLQEWSDGVVLNTQCCGLLSGLVTYLDPVFTCVLLREKTARRQ